MNTADNTTKDGSPRQLKRKEKKEKKAEGGGKESDGGKREKKRRGNEDDDEDDKRAKKDKEKPITTGTTSYSSVILFVQAQGPDGHHFHNYNLNDLKLGKSKLARPGKLSEEFRHKVWVTRDLLYNSITPVSFFAKVEAGVGVTMIDDAVKQLNKEFNTKLKQGVRDSWTTYSFMVGVYRHKLTIDKKATPFRKTGNSGWGLRQSTRSKPPKDSSTDDEENPWPKEMKVLLVVR